MTEMEVSTFFADGRKSAEMIGEQSEHQFNLLTIYRNS